MPLTEVNGLRVNIPDPPPKKQMLNHGIKKADQVWTRVPLPDFMEDYDPFEATPEQIDFISTEVDRILNGVWVLINGEPTYLTGDNYFFLQWWKLETGNYPDYREIDRKFFLFWYAAEQYTNCLGIITGKYRRQGASSRGSSISVRIAITEEKVNNGTISKTGTDASEIFREMIIFGFKSLPSFLKPQSTGSDKVVKELVISTQSEKMTKKKRVVGEAVGLNSKISWRGTALNSYDSGRLRFLFYDESGKFPPDVPAYRYWNIVRRCLVVGAKRVGMAYLPSTVNALKEGGAEFKKLWKASNHLIPDFNGKTNSGLFKFFAPCFEGFEGYIGKYGESIIENPTPAQVAYLKTVDECPDPTIGAKQYHDRERKSLEGDDDALVEYIRQNPYTEKEMFYEPSSHSIVSAKQANEQLEDIEDATIPFVTGEFYRDIATNTVRFRADDTVNEKSPWKFLWGIGDEFVPNKHIMRYGKKVPVNTNLFSIGCDPYASSQGSSYGKGSKGVAYVKRSFVPTDPNNSDMPIGRLNYRPKLKYMFHEQVFMAAEYFSCLAAYEQTIDDFYDYAIENGYDNYMVYTPEELVGSNMRKDKNGKKKRKAGVPGTSKKSIEFHTEALKSDWNANYHKYWFKELIEDLIPFDPTDRTDYDDSMAWGYTLIGEHTCRVNVVEDEDDKPKPVYLKTYDITKKFGSPNLRHNFS